MAPAVTDHSRRPFRDGHLDQALHKPREPLCDAPWIALEAEQDTREAGDAEGPPAGGFLQRRGPLLATLATIVVVAGIFAAIPAFRHAVSLSLHGDLSGLRHYIRGLGLGGAALLMGLILVHAVVPYPSEILTSTAGFVYGFLPGLLFAIVGWTVVALLTYGIGLTIGRPVLRTLLGKRFTDLERGMESGGVRLMLVARLLPVVPLALLGYVAGATRESVWRLTWTSFVGYLPLVALVAYLGSQAKSLSTSNPLLWIAVVVIILLLVGPHFWNRHQQHKQHPRPTPTADPED